MDEAPHDLMDGGVVPAPSLCTFGDTQKAVKQPAQQNQHQASALRCKYRELEKLRFPPGFVGAHYDNRNGMFLNDDRCEELTLDFVGDFDGEEADHQCVLVRAGPHCDRIHAFNLEGCRGNARMVGPFDGVVVQLGSCGHSHVNQVLKNLIGGAKPKKEALSFLVDA